MDPKFVQLAREDARYACEAYEFVCDAVTYTQDQLGRGGHTNPDEPIREEHHVSGAELVKGACALAVREFGMMAPLVFRQWGLEKTDDFGELVFKLIEADKLSKSDRDEVQDFQNLFDLHQALVEQFELTAAAYPAPKGNR